MPANPKDLFDACWRIKDQLDKAQAELTTLRSHLAQLNLPDNNHRHHCHHPHCGLPFKTEARLNTHLRNVHGEYPADT